MELLSPGIILAWCTIDLVFAGQFQLHDSDSASWATAENRCEEKDRSFAKIDDPTDQMWMEKIGPYVGFMYYWIGLNAESGSFVWADGTVMEYTNWVDGYPGTAAGFTCVRVRTSDFKWETHNCSAELNYMCEDIYFKYSEIVGEDTKTKGLLLGLGTIGGVLILLFMLLQLPCCRTNVTQKIVHFGFGTKDIDKKGLI